MPNGSAIQLQDVARIELGKDSYASYSRLNGRPRQRSACNSRPTGQCARDVEGDPREARRDFAVAATGHRRASAVRRLDIRARRDQRVTLLEAILLVFFAMRLFLCDLRYTLDPTSPFQSH